MTEQDEKVPTAADFERLFGHEPAMTDPGADLRRGRRRRAQRRVVAGVVAVVAVAAVGGTAVVTLGGQSAPFGPVGSPSAIPVPPRPPAPSTTGTPSSASSPDRPPRDTAPTLRRNAKGAYLDKRGLSLDGSLMDRDPNANPFQATTQNSWTLARRHLDPSGQHLGAYEPFAFTGGGSGDGLQIGQKLGWTVQGDSGQGVVQLAVTRPLPGATLQLGPGRPDAAGFCTDVYVTDTTCRKTTVAGVEVYLAETPDGGFIMDRRQGDGEVASILVSPVFGNNTDVSLRSMKITTTMAANLLNDWSLDVVG